MQTNQNDEGRIKRKIHEFIKEAESCEAEADRAATSEEAVDWQELADRWRGMAALYRTKLSGPL
ncbi:hypothetical protein [Variibacter gotjawalensis]|uniref:hypothetical protein n=1 Tax=Variibacter gotjawalensis TaxID=1333996 RepID=UPI000BBB3757|nr:hypothetical protein [Variibacter gotjawalensis]NIK49750.1 outer membrane receptor for monomeric catechols [Variibacter gotjawalensis]